MIWSSFRTGRNQMKKMIIRFSTQTHNTVVAPRVSYCSSPEKPERTTVPPSDLITLSYFFKSAHRRRGDHESLAVDDMVPVVSRLTHRHKTLQAIFFQLKSIGCILTKNPKSFLLLLRIFSRAGMHSMFFQAYHHMESHGFVPNTFARNLLMDVHFKMGKTNLALTVFQHTQYPNFFTFDTAIFHLSKLDTDINCITQILRLMLERQHYPRAATFHSLLKFFCKINAMLVAHQLMGLTVVLGIEFSVDVWTILIHKCCQLGRLDVAAGLWRNMVRTGCSPNVVTYTTLFKAFVESDMVADAIRLLDSMYSAGHVPDLVLCNVLIDCLSKVGSHHRDEIEAFISLSDQNIQPDSYTFTSLLSTTCPSRMVYRLAKLALVCGYIHDDLVLCNALLSSFAKAGRPSLAVGFYDYMIDEGVEPDKYSRAALLSALCAARRIDEAFLVYRGAVMSCHKTDAHVHTEIISELMKAGQYNKAASVFKSAVVNEYPLDNVAYTVGIRALLRSGETREAHKFYNRMKDNGLKPNAHTCNTMLFTFCKEKDLQMVNQMLKEMIGSRMELSDTNFTNLYKFPYRSESSDAYSSTLNLLAEMGDLGLSAKALPAISFVTYPESVKEKYEHCAEVNTEWNLVLDSSSSEDMSDVAASVD